MEYTTITNKCSACKYNVSLEHKLYHQTGVSEDIIKELNLKSVIEIEQIFIQAKKSTKCYIYLGTRRTKISEGNKYFFPKKIISLISFIRE